MDDLKINHGIKTAELLEEIESPFFEEILKAPMPSQFCMHKLTPTMKWEV